MTPERRRQLHELLCKDDVPEVQRTFTPKERGLEFEAWFKCQVVSVMNTGPNVLKFWLDENVHLRSDRVYTLYGYLGLALESLDDNDKITLLLGRATQDAHHNLYKFLYNGRLSNSGSHWAALSPVWVGEEGSELRQAAASLGWIPELFHRSFERCMQTNPNWESWLNKIPYPYSRTAVHWIQMVALSKRLGLPLISGVQEGEAFGRPSKRLVVSPKAEPQDIALAWYLFEQHGQDFPQALVMPAEPHGFTREASLQVKTVVDVHTAMGLFHVIGAHLIEGRLPGMDPDGRLLSTESTPLPEM